MHQNTRIHVFNAFVLHSWCILVKTYSSSNAFKAHCILYYMYSLRRRIHNVFKHRMYSRPWCIRHHSHVFRRTHKLCTAFTQACIQSVHGVSCMHMNTHVYDIFLNTSHSEYYMNTVHEYILNAVCSHAFECSKFTPKTCAGIHNKYTKTRNACCQKCYMNALWIRMEKYEYTWMHTSSVC